MVSITVCVPGPRLKFNSIIITQAQLKILPMESVEHLEVGSKPSSMFLSSQAGACGMVITECHSPKYLHRAL